MGFDVDDALAGTEGNDMDAMSAKTGPQRMRRRSLAVAAVLASTLALTAAACSTGGPKGAASDAELPSTAHGRSADPRSALLASVTTTESVRSAAFDFSVSVNGTPRLGGLVPSSAGSTPGPIALTVSGHGAYSFVDKTGETTITLPTIGQTPAQTVQVREIGDEIYLSTPRLQAVDGGKPWVSVNVSQYEQSQGHSSSPIGNLSLGDPNQILGMLEHLGGSVTQQGTSDVEGVPTTEYAATINLAGPAGTDSGTANPTILSPQIAQALGLTAIPIHVWVDSQGRARQIETTFTVLGLAVDMRADLGSFGTPVSVQVPPPDQVADGSGLLHSGQLGSLLAPV
jgi:hypothetical protein